MQLGAPKCLNSCTANTDAQKGPMQNDAHPEIDEPRRFVVSLLKLWDLEVFVSERMALGFQAVMIQLPPIAGEVISLRAEDLTPEMLQHPELFPEAEALGDQEPAT